jgi:membrane-bound metal-dependent hydrolase YbcI (DUF457 family)
MPLPIIHSYVGYSIYKLSKTEEEKQNWTLAVLFMLLANLADFDVIPGMMLGDPDLFHRSFTHSVAAAVLCAAVVAGAGKLLKSKISSFKFFCVSLAAYFSHVFLDAFTGTVSFVWWPFQVKVAPVTFAGIFEHAQPVVSQCPSVNQFFSMLVCSTLTLRLAAEALFVCIFHSLIRAFSRSRAAKTGVSESPVLIAGLTIFLFVVTALILTEVAG